MLSAHAVHQVDECGWAERSSLSSAALLLPPLQLHTHAQPHPHHQRHAGRSWDMLLPMSVGRGKTSKK